MASSQVSENIKKNVKTKLFNKILKNANVWFGIKENINDSIEVMENTFILSNCLDKILGQFISSKWFSTEISIQKTCTLYTIIAEKQYTCKFIENYLNSETKNIEENILYDKFELKSDILYDMFDNMVLGNIKSTRINITSSNNSDHILNIDLSVRHLFEDNYNDDNEIKESIVISTPIITYK